MSLLIDTPRWAWRGRLWAHLVSDRSLEELHTFARAVPLRYLSFGCDHYDVPEELWPRSQELGAELVDSRELVARIRTAGLRVPGGKQRRAWQRAGSLDEVNGIDDTVRAAAHQLVAGEAGAEASVFERPGEQVIIIARTASSRSWAEAAVGTTDPIPGVEHIIATRDEHYDSLELVLAAPAGPGRR